MKSKQASNLILCLLSLCPLLPASASLSQSPLPRDPVQVIFDTDMGNDIDDALALAMLHTMQDQGNCKIQAITLTIPHKYAAPYTAALNTFYGHPDIPIGINPKSLYPSTGFLRHRDFLIQSADRERWPSHYDETRPLKALPLLRKTLADAAPGSVVIIQVGSFTNLADLLKSPPDDISPLPGIELVRQKVSLLSIMGGNFQDPSTLEFNIMLDQESAQYVTAHWPGPRIWSGFEVGNAIRFPKEFISKGLPQGHIIEESYQRYVPTPHERPCWDLTSTWVAVHPSSPLFTRSENGTVSIDEKGRTFFTPQSDGLDRYLILSVDKIPALRKLFTEYVKGGKQAAMEQ